MVNYKSGSIVPRWVMSVRPRKYQHLLKFGSDVCITREKGFIVITNANVFAINAKTLILNNNFGNIREIFGGPYCNGLIYKCFKIGVNA